MTASLLAHGRTYGAIEPLPDGKGWRITEIEPHVAMRLKAIFPRIPRTGRPPFDLVGGPQIDADLQWFMDRYPLRIDPGSKTLMLERKTLFDVQQAELSSILSPDWKPATVVGFREGQRPYDYQVQAAELARRTGRLLLMDEMGLGKTVSAIAAIVAAEHLPALVVPQTHLPGQWAEKVAEFTTLRTHIIKQTKPYELPPADVYICPYSKLAGWIDFAETAGFKSVVFDEIQELRAGRGTAKGQAAHAFAAQAEMVIGLSGTPIYNYGDEIYRIVSFLDEDALGTWLDFCIEWCKHSREVHDPQALGTFLREQQLALRRTRGDVGHERQFANIITTEVPFDSKVISADAEVMASLARQVLTGSFVERGQAARDFDLRLRHATGVAKAPHAAAFVKMLLEAGQPVLLCGWHRDVYEIWQRELHRYNPVLYTGTESVRQKNEAKDHFTSGVTNLMIMSLRSGAGLDGLQQRCSTIVFGELDWSPQVHAQCIARLDRPGQTRQVDAIYLHADGGSDPSMIGVLGVKASQSAGIVDPLAAATEQVSDTSRIRQLAAAYLEGKSPSVPRPPAPPARDEPAAHQMTMF
ncbi:MAG: SNF2-related protein [Hyphomicrobiaceae bacterium]